MTIRDIGNLDEKSKKILAMLMEDGARSMASISEKIDISESAVRKRIKKLVENGVIEKFTIKINPKFMKRDVQAFITIITKKGEDFKRLLNDLKLYPECCELHLLAGRCGIMTKVACPNMEELNAFIELIRSRTEVDDIESCVVLKPVKESFVDNQFN
ncbi:MAG: Lrp/AsnC family transcriptional regulator [Candidatus Hodarchaeota archaeon]